MFEKVSYTTILYERTREERDTAGGWRGLSLLSCFDAIEGNGEQGEGTYVFLEIKKFDLIRSPLNKYSDLMT